jgi:hypothetical protein
VKRLIGQAHWQDHLCHLAMDRWRAMRLAVNGLSGDVERGDQRQRDCASKCPSVRLQGCLRRTKWVCQILTFMIDEKPESGQTLNRLPGSRPPVAISRSGNSPVRRSARILMSWA